MSVKHFVVANSNGVNQVDYKTQGSIGFDIAAIECATLQPGEFLAIRTGLFVKPIPGTRDTPFLIELQIRPRSGLAISHGITVLNAPGTIDEDYKQEIKVILINHSKVPFEISPGDRIAQGVFAVAYRPPSARVENVIRVGGFGSTGKN
jgi:dUTP pyrophosphatase